MRSREVIADVQDRMDRANDAWHLPNTRDTHLERAVGVVLDYIADEMTHADINTAKRLASIARGDTI